MQFSLRPIDRLRRRIARRQPQPGASMPEARTATEAAPDTSFEDAFMQRALSCAIDVAMARVSDPNRAMKAADAVEEFVEACNKARELLQRDPAPYSPGIPTKPMPGAGRD